MVTVSARLLARDRAVADRLRGMRDLGRVSGARYIHDDWGMRARMDEFTAPGREHVFFNYVARSPSLVVREQFERCLRAAGIEVAEAYTLVSDQRPYRTGRLPCRVEALDVARAVVGLITHIPLLSEVLI